jgi:serine/threonine-protein kinase
VADAVMHGLTTDPAERFASAVSFGTALAEAGTEAWGWGWLSADGMPVVSGAERIVAPTRGSVIPSDPPTGAGVSGPRSPASGGAAAEASRRGAPADVPAAERTPQPSSSVPGAAGQETVAAAGSPAPDAEVAGRPRKRWVGVVIALVVALVLVAAVLLVPRLFTVYVAPAGGLVPLVLDLLGRAT